MVRESLLEEGPSRLCPGEHWEASDAKLGRTSPVKDSHMQRQRGGKRRCHIGPWGVSG